MPEVQDFFVKSSSPVVDDFFVKEQPTAPASFLDKAGPQINAEETLAPPKRKPYEMPNLDGSPSSVFDENKRQLEMARRGMAAPIPIPSELRNASQPSVKKTWENYPLKVNSGAIVLPRKANPLQPETRLEERQTNSPDLSLWESAKKVATEPFANPEELHEELKPYGIGLFAIHTGLLEAANEMANPLNVGIGAVTGGVGNLAKTAAAPILRTSAAALGTAASTYFAGDMLGSVGAQYPEIKEAVVRASASGAAADWEDAISKATKIGTTAAMAVLSAWHAIGSGTSIPQKVSTEFSPKWRKADAEFREVANEKARVKKAEESAYADWLRKPDWIREGEPIAFAPLPPRRKTVLPVSEVVNDIISKSAAQRPSTGEESAKALDEQLTARESNGPEVREFNPLPPRQKIVLPVSEVVNDIISKSAAQRPSTGEESAKALDEQLTINEVADSLRLYNRERTQAAQAAARALKANVFVPETGISNAEELMALDKVAQDVAQVSFDKLSPEDQDTVRKLVAEGYGKAVQLPQTKPAPSLPPLNPTPGKSMPGQPLNKAQVDERYWVVQPEKPNLFNQPEQSSEQPQLPPRPYVNPEGETVYEKVGDELAPQQPSMSEPEPLPVRQPNIGEEGVIQPVQQGPRVEYGDSGTMRIPNSSPPTSYEYRHGIIESSDLIPSHDANNFQHREDYAPLQNQRDYSKAPDQKYIESSASKRSTANPEGFDHDVIADNGSTPESGPTITEPDNQKVLGANGRTLMQQVIYRNANRSPEALQHAAELRRNNIELAVRRGIPREVAETFREPINTRELVGDMDDATKQRLIGELNPVSARELTASEKAVSDGKLIGKGETINGVNTVERIAALIKGAGEGASLRDALRSSNATVLVDHLINDGLISPSNRHTAIEGGELSDALKLRIENALVGKLFDSSQHMDDTSDSVKAILKAIAPDVMRVHGNPEWDITDTVKEAVSYLDYLKAMGLKKAAVPTTGIEAAREYARPLVNRKYLTQEQLDSAFKDGRLTKEGKRLIEGAARNWQFDQAKEQQLSIAPEFSEKAQALARVLRKGESSKADVVSYFREYATKAAKEILNENQFTLGDKLTPGEIFQTIFETPEDERPGLNYLPPKLEKAVAPYTREMSNQELVSGLHIEPIPLEGADFGRAIAYTASPQTIEMIGRLEGKGDAGDHGVGLHWNPSQIASKLAGLKNIFNDDLHRLSIAAKEAMQAGKSFILINGNEKISEAVRTTALQEELNHAAQRALHGTKKDTNFGAAERHISDRNRSDLDDTSIIGEIAFNKLQEGGYFRGAVDPGVVIAEIAVRMMAPGRLGELGLTMAEARSWAATYVKTLREEYGHEKPREIAQKVFDALRKPGSKKPDNATTGVRQRRREGTAQNARSDLSGDDNAGELFGNQQRRDSASASRSFYAKLLGDQLTAEFNSPISRASQLEKLKPGKLPVQEELVAPRPADEAQGSLFYRMTPEEQAVSSEIKAATDKQKEAEARTKPQRTYMEALANLKTKWIDNTSAFEDTVRSNAIAAKDVFKLNPSDEPHMYIDRAAKAGNYGKNFINKAGVEYSPEVGKLIGATPDANGKFTTTRSLASLVQSLSKTEQEYLDQYMIAKRTQATGQGVGGRDQAADKKVIDTLKAKYDPLAKEVYAYNDAVLQQAIDFGLINKEAGKKLRKDHGEYVSIERIREMIDEATGDFKDIGRSRDNQIPPVTKALASTATQSVVKGFTKEGKVDENQIKSPLNASLAKTYQVFSQGLQNEAARGMVNSRLIPGMENYFTEVNPKSMRILEGPEKGKEVKAGDTISYLDNGQKKTFKTTPEFVNVAKSLDVYQMSLMEKTLANMAQYFKTGTVGVNALFAAKNYAKDSVERYLNTPTDIRQLTMQGLRAGDVKDSSILSQLHMRPDFAVNMVKSLAAAFGHGEEYQRIHELVGADGTTFDLINGNAQETLESVSAQKDWKTKAKYIVTKNPAKMGHRFATQMAHLISRTEEANRIQAFMDAEKMALKAGYDKTQAAALGEKAYKQFTGEFTRGGDYRRAIGYFQVFLNAATQGTRSSIQAMERDPGGYATRLIATVLIPAAMTTAWNLSDEKRRKVYEDLQPYYKDKSLFLIMDDEKGKDNRYHVWSVPTRGTQELGNIVARSMYAAYKKNPQLASQIFGDMVGAISPITASPGGLPLMALPQAVGGLAAVAFNKDPFTGKQIVPDYMSRNSSPNERSFDSTSATAKALASGVNKMGGAVAPIQMDYLAKWYGGSVMPQIMNAADTAIAIPAAKTASQFTDSKDVKRIAESAPGGTTMAGAFTRQFATAPGGAVSDVERGKTAAVRETVGDDKLPAQRLVRQIVDNFRSGDKATALQLYKDGMESGVIDDGVRKSLGSRIKDVQAGLAPWESELKHESLAVKAERIKQIYRDAPPDEALKLMKDLRSKGILTKDVLAEIMKSKVNSK